MRKAICFIAALAVVFALAGCVEQGPDGPRPPEGAAGLEGTEDGGSPENSDSQGSTATSATVVQTSRTNPAKVNQTAVYDSLGEEHDAYKFEVTLLEVLRGGAALKKVKQANSYSQMPPDGKEYLLAKFKVSFLEAKKDDPFMAQSYFDIVKPDGNTYSQPNAYIDISEIGALSTMYRGATQEGYVCFTVDKKDEKLLIAFPKYLGSQIWFSADATAGSEDDGYNPLGDPNRPGSKNNPAEINQTASYNSIDLSPYMAFNINITVTEIDRGQRAMDMVTLASRYNEPPPKGKEYLLANVKIEAIESKDDSVIEIGPSTFKLFSKKGLEYTERPYLSGFDGQGLSRMFPGAVQEGQVAFFVDTGDESPLIVFAAESEIPVWILAAGGNTEPIIDPNAPGTKNNPVALKKSLEFDTNLYGDKCTLEMTVLDVKRGSLSKKEQSEMGIDVKDLKAGMEFLVVKVKVKALEGKSSKVIEISDYDFELVSESGVKYDRVFAYGSAPKLKDMYSGGTQEGFIFFQVKKSDNDPRVVFKGDYDGDGVWFSLKK